MNQFQFVFDTEHPDLKSFESFIQQVLKLHQLDENYKPEAIISIACNSNENQLDVDSVTTVQVSWLKTRCIEIISDRSLQLSVQRENRQKFDRAVQALFIMKNPDTQSFWSNVSCRLHQFRLSRTYKVQDIVVEAYAIGVRRIESGTIIKIPLAWLRTTCFNVIRDLRKEQDRLGLRRRRLDSEGLTPGDEVISGLIIAEDRRALRLAFNQLTHKDRQILCDRILKGLSWQTIGESLSHAEGIEVTANTARQRGFRALEKLRQVYGSIRHDVGAVEDELEVPLNCELKDFEPGKEV